MAESSLVYAAISSQQLMTLVINIGEITSDYITHMEDVLDQYEQPCDPKHPLICMDGMPCQLIDTVLVPVPPKPGNWEQDLDKIESRVSGSSIKLERSILDVILR